MNAPATTRACPKCSFTVSADTKFCPNCVSGIFSGGGSPMEGTAVLGVEQVDTLFPLLQDATLGDYDIYGELGRGGMAAVYLALDLSLNRKVAIKTMLPDLVSRAGMVDRFKREAQTAAALSHPHIIQIFSVKDTKRLVYFVMKYIEGRSLESVIIERGKLDVDLTRVILSQVGGALAFAHRKGVVHRDMKPANIMLEEDGWAIVTDFGIAKVQEAQNLTATGTAIGTPHYMSPEQFHNKAVTGCSDQYSLGIVAYEMLTGKKPFDGATYAEIITQHLFEPPPDLRTVRPDIPPNIAETVMRMMAKEASARFADLDAAVAALGTPTTTQGDKARTAIISLAKNPDSKGKRMSVPQSPIPAQRRAPAPTVVESEAARPAPAAKRPPAPPAKTQTNSHTSLAMAAVVLLLVGGGGMFAYLKFGGTTASPTQSNVASQGIALDPGAATNPPPAQIDSATMIIARNDSIAAAAAAATPPVEVKRIEPKPPTRNTGGTKTDTKVAATSTKSAGAGPGTARSDEATKTSSAVKPTVEAAPPAAPPVSIPPKASAVAGQIKIGTVTDGAVLYVNGAAWGTLKALTTIDVTAKSDGSLKLSLSAANCTTWDSTVSVTAGSLTVVGRRNLTCK